MRDLSCLSTIINDNLAVHIDLTSSKSWNLNSGFTSVSLSKWSGAFSSDIFLYDFGLTGFDNGRVNEMTDSLTLTPQDTKLTLYRVGYNNPTGGTFYDGYGITGVTFAPTGVSVGNYFLLDGGYLQGFFKLKDYPFQIMPYRYAKGVTIETIIFVTPESFNDGYFLLMGARSEDKYIPPFTGECVTYTATTTGTTAGSRGIYTYITSQKMTSGVTTSEDNFLDSVSLVTVPKKAINDQHHTEEIEIENLNNDIDSNVIGFYLSSEGKIGYTRVDSKGIVVGEESTYAIKTGWTIITLVFDPYEDITDKSLLDCTEVRAGDFFVYVNGRKFWKLQDFTEFYFRGFKNAREKQLGVPYNVSWGGGSFGLQHSYHWELNPRTIFDGNSPLQFASGYTFIQNPTVVYECPPEPISGYTQYLTVSADSTTFHRVDPCDPLIQIPNTVLAITHDGASGMTTTNEYYLEYITDLELISNRDYTFTVNFYDRDIFALYSISEAGMFFLADVDIEVLEEKKYETNIGHPNEWFEIRYKIRLQKNTNKQIVRVGLYVNSDMVLNNGFAYYFDDFKFVGSDKLVQDPVKANQTIERTFNKSFVGGIQKLRIYDAAFNAQEVLHNAIIEAKNPAYGFIISKGGRLIYE